MLNVGDKVVLQNSGGGYISEVIRVTKTMAFIEKIPQKRFNRESGYEIGRDIGQYSRYSIRVATDADIRLLEEAQLRDYINNLVWNKIPIDIVREVAVKVKAYRASEKIRNPVESEGNHAKSKQYSR